MKKQKSLYLGLLSITAFVLWTVALIFVDTAKIAPQETRVGFATLNKAFHNLTGVNTSLYDLTDTLSIIPLAVAGCFGVLGLVQWIKRKSLLKVDFNLLVLGGFYITVLAVYALFEVVVLNYRPILIEGVLEASYPSSTTLLTTCVMPTLSIECGERVKSTIFKKSLKIFVTLFILFMVGARLVSGVHWLSDIVGGGLLSLGLVMIYRSVRREKN